MRETTATILLFALLCPVCLGAQTPDVRWHIEGAGRRALVRVWAPATDGQVDRPLRIAGLAGQGGMRAWCLKPEREIAAQASGEDLLLDPAQPLAPGEERRYFVYAQAQSGPAPPAARVDETGVVETPKYVAKVDARRGGAITSLLLKDGGRRVETLGEGIRWWVGRNPQVTQESFGTVSVERVAAGPVFAAMRVVYPDLLAAGNSFAVEYRFFKDFIEADYHYRAVRPARLEWLKIPVSLRATGRTPGLFSNAAVKDAPMLVEGPSNKWIMGERWHDVSYLGDEPFGMGVAARGILRGGLFYMDSVKADEREWIYAEPFGWKNPVDIESDFDVRFTVVPHPAGKGRYADTLAKVEGAAGFSISAFQEKGGPMIDTDADGLPDLAELERNTNPNCADTDMDGLADGQDPDPLKGDAPALRIQWPGFTAKPAPQPQSIAQVKPVQGVPTLVIDGKPYGPMIYTRCAGTWEQLGQIADRNFPVHFEMVGSVGWPGAQEETFRRIDERLGRFLDQVPNGRVILRLYVCSPPRFAKDYPEETLTFNDGGRGHFTKWYAMKDRPPEERGYPSFASELWRQKTAEALYHLVTHVRQSAYAKNVIGYFVCGGGTEEWYYWGDYDHNKFCVDFSPPMLKAFRDYLRVKYEGDVGKLRAAWGDPQCDFGAALPPGPQRRRSPGAGVFWDPAKDQAVRDYYYVHNKVMEDSLLIFSRAVKQACNGEQLVGMFHGYLQNHWLLEGGQATLKDLLNSADVDFWSGPPQYDRRGQGEHACVRFLMASLKKHGKLWISESDIRTCHSETAPGNPALYGRPPDMEESLACLTREFAHQLCEGGNGWWFQMGKNWYHHEPILSLFDRMQRCGEAALAFDRASDTDIAAVVDLDSLLTGPPWPVSSALLDAFKVQETCRIGAPVDHYELEDILALDAARQGPDAKRYKMCLMINCFSLDDRKRRLIAERLRRDGAVLVWMYAPGLMNPDRRPELSTGHIAELLGMELESETGEPMSMNMKLTEEGARFFAGFAPDRIFGGFERPQWTEGAKAGEFTQRLPGETKLPQRFWGGAGEALARFVEGGRPSILARRTAQGTDIWIGSVMAPADLLRSVARQAGCHLYCDGDEIIYANKSFLAIHTAKPGERTFNLRRKADVVEIFSDTVLGEGVTQFKDTIGAYRTRVYFIGDRHRWTDERRRADEFFALFQQELKTMRARRAARQTDRRAAP